METVKKLVLSLSVIVLFALYALQKQAQPLVRLGTAPQLGAGDSRAGLVASSPAAAWHPAVDQAATMAVVTATLPPTPGVRSVAFFAGDVSDATAMATMPPRPTATSTPDVTATTIPTEAAPTPTLALAQGQYRDGTYEGDPADANWGQVAVQAVIAGGRLSDVRILQYPDHHGRSVVINQQALPILIQEAIQAQQAQVDVVSGASDTSDAFIQSLGAALQQATS